MKGFSMPIREAIASIKSGIPENVKLVAVSKTRTIPEIMEAFHHGHTIFGENKAQELISKQPLLPSGIEWHFIGHLQRNKVKYIVPFVSLIHGVDSMRLLAEINKESAKINRLVDCLLQFHIADEETKFGLDLPGARQILESEEFKTWHHVRICGVMGMASFTGNEAKIRSEFRNLKSIFTILKTDYFTDKPWFREISAGMTNDYTLAVEEGSTIIRIGSAIFGEREYTMTNDD